MTTPVTTPPPVTIDWKTGAEIPRVAPKETPVPTLIAMLLDRSGSMETCKSDAEGGFNSFIAAQRELGGVCKVTLAQFDGQSYDTVYELLDVAKVPPLHLDPRGNTPLHDSVARIITNTQAALDGMPADNRPAKIIVVIVTDGFENASREWSGERVKALIDSKTGWDFVYVGAHADAFTQARGMGISSNSSLQTNSASTIAAYAATSDAVSRSRMTGAAVEYTDEEREQADQ